MVALSKMTINKNNNRYIGPKENSSPQIEPLYTNIQLFVLYRLMELFGPPQVPGNKATNYLFMYMQFNRVNLVEEV